jgi:hypothetical protein
MRRTRSQRAYVYFAVAMAVLMGASLIFPALQDNTVQQQVEPTVAPTSTLPATPQDVSAISLDQTYFHPSGLFTVAQPEGWAPGNPSNNGTQAQINMRNPELLSVIEAYVEIPTVPVSDLAGLDTHFNDAMVEAGWRSYSDARETGRRYDEENNRLVIDFELEQARTNYLARHIAWTDGSWIYVIRVVVTPNMLNVLNYLIDNLPPTLQPQKLFAESPAGWTSFYYPQGNEIIRYPSGWTVTDGQPGSPVTISGLGGETLRIEVPTEATIADEAAAQAYVVELRPGVTPGSVQAVERNGATGFAVSYNSTTLEGEGESGMTTLLNGEDGLLHVASVRVPIANLDLNALAEGAPVAATDAANVMESFNLTLGLNLPVPTATPTSTPTAVVPTAAPTDAPASTEEVVGTEDTSGVEVVETEETPLETEEAATAEAAP